jgi:hypothetical protein
MTAPVTPYARVFNFQNQQALTPASPIPANQLDAELNAVLVTFNSFIAALSLVQRDDGALKNATVGYDQLKAELSAGFAPPHVWTTSNAYTTADAVFHETSFYRCLVAHTSGVFATDLATGKWQLVYNFEEIFAQLADDIGLDGWSPVFALESNGEERVLKVVDWTGGDGEKPAVDKYVGVSGLVDAIGDGVDVRGAEGAASTVPGDPGADGATWFTGDLDPDDGNGANGDFYLQTGTGATGVAGDVWTKSAGTWSITGNIRGPAGTGDVSIDGSVTAGNLTQIIDGSTIEDSGIAAADVLIAADIGTTVQAYDADLTSIAALTTSAYGRGLLESVDAAATRTALELGDGATKNTGTSAGTVAAGDHTHTASAVGAIPADDVHEIVLLADQAAYDALDPPDSNTAYYIPAE